ncbi:type II toxin-antitoxin system HicB family antitoxin [cf. Phormidesmis sp. LEGE 11477]|uniref:type II toxin-antitoxin system HicB family antitoxin n=1 Tax=cf. Phormidesmis sp. LEGE 11477 TaxID=1828680 RepID=UPI001882F36A|nr:type II toxin-antitoxin system HicB family antitoxin [cf. Phormidesmis sp. LEGE 11477]MBE9062259.1 type II toxin-antitoxin system HicB family antitoxin [cf. Phormidesmis sp. LEGE 11477]
MQYQVLVRKPSEQHFVASVMGLSDMVADGKTEEEAIGHIKAMLVSQLSNAKLVSIDIDSDIEIVATNGSQPDCVQAEDPWIKRAGIFEGDPTWDDFLSEIETYRREMDERTSQ